MTVNPQLWQPVNKRDSSFRTEDNEASVIVAGSLAIDLSCDYLPQEKAAHASQPQPQTSNPSSIRQSIGGVGHNVASALHHMGTTVRLCSSIASDVAGSTAIATLAKRGLSTTGIRTIDAEARTAQYVAINDANRNLVLAMADMEILERSQDDFDASWKTYP